MLNTQLRISSPIPGTYCVFGLDQRPAVEAEKAAQEARERVLAKGEERV